MATLREMMQMQERMFKTMFESVLSSVNTRIDEVVKSSQVKLNLDCEPEIERAHRIGPKPRTTVPNVADGLRTRLRTIVCRLRDWKQKEGILRAARQTKPSGLFVSEDLAAETLDKRSSQLDKLKEAKRAGKIAYFVLDRLIVKDRPPRESR